MADLAEKTVLAFMGLVELAVVTGLCILIVGLFKWLI